MSETLEKRRKEGVAAFPSGLNEGKVLGMTLREYFAAQAREDGYGK